MQRNGIGKSIWSGALAAAAFFMAPEAHAVGWCPTPTDNKITCSNCSRELTCPVNGFGIFILGNNVILDGKSQTISYAPYEAVTVTGYGNTIKYVNVHYAGGEGFEFNGTIINAPGTNLDHVYVANSDVGIFNNSRSPATIINSSVYYSHQMGVKMGYERHTDVRNSTLNSNGRSGINVHGIPNNSWILGNTVAYNQQHGMEPDNTSGWRINGNSFYGNARGGLYLIGFSGTVTNNYGRNNGFNWHNFDCEEAHGQQPVSITRYGNDWGNWAGWCNP
jgi:hypothetical protein